MLLKNRNKGYLIALFYICIMSLGTNKSGYSVSDIIDFSSVLDFKLPR